MNLNFSCFDVYMNVTLRPSSVLRGRSQGRLILVLQQLQDPQGTIHATEQSSFPDSPLRFAGDTT